MVQQHRGMFKRWNVSLMFLTFILCIFGTYLTRSGVIDSVHAFGGSLLGTFFLVFLVLLGIASVGLFAWRYRLLAPEHELEGLVSREGAFLGGNVLLLIMMLTTLTGTIFPLLSGPFAGDPITVKPPFYNKVVAPMGILLVGSARPPRARSPAASSSRAPGRSWSRRSWRSRSRPTSGRWSASPSRRWARSTSSWTTRAPCRRAGAARARDSSRPRSASSTGTTAATAGR
jgi:hypothetical protein